MSQLAGRTAVVTGASSGIGAASARALAREGASVVLAARRPERLAEVVRAIEAEGGRAHAAPTDVTVEAEVQALFRTAEAASGPVDLLVNCAGLADHTVIEELSLERWRAVLDANLTSAFLCAREALKTMKPRGRGRIISIGSISARSPRRDAPAYSAAKYALDGLTRWLALDGRDHGVSASILHPGFTVSGFGGDVEGAKPSRDRMSADHVARLVVMMAAAPDEMNVLEAVALPLGMPFLGRG